MALLMLIVFAGVVVTGVVQAAEPTPIRTKPTLSQRPGSFWGIDLMGKLRDWVTRAQDSGSGLALSRPFGRKGPALRISNALPDEAEISLRAGSGPALGSRAAMLGNDRPDAFIFFQKRW